jgi:MFS family permease
VDLRSETYGTIRGANEESEWSEVDETEKSQKPNSICIWNKRIVGYIVALCIFTYHSMTYDHLMPIFFEDDRKTAMDLIANASLPSIFYSPGGLGLSVRTVGMIMAINGLIALFVQAVVFPIAAERIGVYKLFLIVTVLHPVAYAVVPLLVLVPESLVLPAVYVCLAIRNTLSITLYPLLLILIKDATPSANALGKVNGLAASAGAACRMIAPPVAGYLYTFGARINCTGLAWYGSALVAIIGGVQCFHVPRERSIDEQSGECALSNNKQGMTSFSSTMTTETLENEADSLRPQGETHAVQRSSL